MLLLLPLLVPLLLLPFEFGDTDCWRIVVVVITECPCHRMPFGVTAGGGWRVEDDAAAADDEGGGEASVTVVVDGDEQFEFELELGEPELA